MTQRPHSRPEDNGDHLDHEHAPEHADQLDARTLAAIDLWDAQTRGQAMPASVRSRCLAAMTGAMSGNTTGNTTGATIPLERGDASIRWKAPAAVIALAATLAAAAIGLYAVSRPSPIERRDAFIAGNPDTVVTPLRLAEPGAFNCGEVAWSPDRERLFILATGMAANRPSEHRYTLWATTPRGRVEVARFDITDPTSQVIALPARGLTGIPGEVGGFTISLEAVAPGIEPASVPVATSDPI